MYKFIFPLLLSLLPISVLAQNNEIKVMYSPMSLQRIDDWGRNLDGLSGKYTGSFIIDYNYYLNPRLKLGINVSYDQKKLEGTKTTTFINPMPPYNYVTMTYHQSNKEGWLFFGPQLGFDYIQKDKFRMGSLVGVSIVLINQEDIVDPETTRGTDTNIFFHVELINFTLGKNHGLTGQLGYGHKGLVSFGYFIRW